MTNKTMKTLIVAICMTIAITQVSAVENVDTADTITRGIWTATENTNTLSKADTITNTAWTSQAEDEKELVAMGEYTPVAYAADEAEANPADKVALTAWESEAVTTEADAVAKVAWAEQEATAKIAKNDAVAQTAWTQEEKELVAMGEYTPVAYAADEAEANPTDEMVKAIWTRKPAETDKGDSVTQAVWNKNL